MNDIPRLAPFRPLNRKALRKPSAIEMIKEFNESISHSHQRCARHFKQWFSRTIQTANLTVILADKTMQTDVRSPSETEVERQVYRTVTTFRQWDYGTLEAHQENKRTPKN